MKNTHQKLFVFVILFFLSLPMTYFLGLKDHTKIVGVEPITDLPSIQEKSFKDRTFQTEFEKWWNSHFAFRNMFLKMKNSLYDIANLFVIHSGYSKTLIQNKRGYLIGKSYIDLLLSAPCRQDTPKLQTKLSTLTYNLEANDKKVLFVLGASKAQVYQKDLPARFTFFENRKCDIFDYWEKLLPPLGIEFYNTQPLVENMQQAEGWEPYSRTGTHWNVYSSIRVTQEISKKLNLAEIVIDQVELSSENLRGERDFADLFNVYWKYLPHEKFPKVTAHALASNDKAIALIGDSYAGSILDSLVRTKASRQDQNFFVSNRLMDKAEAQDILAKADVYIFIEQASALNDPDAVMLKNIDTLLSVLPKYYMKNWLKSERGTFISTEKSLISIPRSEVALDVSFDIVQAPKDLEIYVNGQEGVYHREGGQMYVYLPKKSVKDGKIRISFDTGSDKNSAIEIKNIKVETAKKDTDDKNINFSEKSLPIKISGLSFAEKWGRWSDADEVRMSLFLPQKADYLFSFTDTHALTPENNPKINADIYCGKRKIATWNFIRGKKTDTRISVKKECLDKDNKVELVFKIKGAARPIDLGINKDQRKLAIGFHGLKITGETK